MSFLPITAAAVGTAGFSGLADAGATEGNSGLEGLGITGATLLGAGTLGLAGKAAHDSWVAPKAEKETGTPTYPTGAKNPPKNFKESNDLIDLRDESKPGAVGHGHSGADPFADENFQGLHEAEFVGHPPLHDTVAAKDLAAPAATRATEQAATTSGKDVAEHIAEDVLRF